MGTSKDENQIRAYEFCRGKGTVELVLSAGPNPRASKPLVCPLCSGGDWGVIEALMPSGFNRKNWKEWL